jgi:hypothetical protein
MPLRSPRFYLSSAQSLLRASPTPPAGQDLTAAGVSHVHVQPCHARNTILLRVSTDVRFTVASTGVAGFTISDRIANTKCVTKLDWCSLHDRSF